MVHKIYSVGVICVIVCFVIHMMTTEYGLVNSLYTKLQDVPILKITKFKPIVQKHVPVIKSSEANRRLFKDAYEWNFFSTVPCGDFQSMTSTKFSRLKLDSIDKDKITVIIFAYNQNNKSKTTGGDVIVLWAEQVDGLGRVSGRITDNLNGSYTGTIPLVWDGLTLIRAKLSSSAQNTCLRYKSLKRYSNVVFSMQKPWGIHGEFRTGLLRERTRCGSAADIYGYPTICNFTQVNDNNSWYCGAPSNTKLRCADVYSFGTGPFYIPGVKASEKVQHAGHAIVNHSLQVNINSYTFKAPTAPCHDVQTNLTWTRYSTSGMFSTTWKPVVCSGLRYHSATNYRQCLRGKNMAIFGDSTVRQYYEYLCTHVLKTRCYMNNGDYGPERSYHSDYVIKAHNVTLLYRKHEQPFHNPDARPNHIKSTPSMIMELADGPLPDETMVIVLNYFSHFLAFKTNEYRLRLSNVVKAIKYLLIKKPLTKIFYKGPHMAIDDTKWFDAKFSLLYRDIVFEEFHDIMKNVIYLDTWDITVTHNSEILHPTGDCLNSQIQQLMSYICA